MTTPTPKEIQQDLVLRSPLWKAYTTYLPQFDGKTPVEVFEEHTQALYNDIFKQARTMVDIDGMGFLGSHREVPLRRILASKPSIITDSLAEQLRTRDVYLKANRNIRSVIVDIEEAQAAYDNDSTAENKVILKENQEKFDNDYLRGKWYTRYLLRWQIDLIDCNAKRKHYVGTSTKQWERRVYKYLVAQSPTELFHSETSRVASAILEAVDSLEPGKLGFLSRPQNVAVPNAEKTLLSDTHKKYVEVHSLLTKMAALSNTLTAEQSHIVETIQTSIIPEGLKNIRDMQKIDAEQAILVESSYLEVLCMSESRLISILAELKSKTMTEANLYYVTSKQLLTL